LGAYDIGQSVIVAGGRIEAIEGAEGTDRMIARAAESRQAGAARGVLVKRSKPGQDLRVDMPAIGPLTVTAAERAGLAGIAVEADKVIAAERAVTLERADAAGLFVEGVKDSEAAGAPRRFDPRAIPTAFRVLGRAAPQEHASLDAIKALAVLDALAAFGVGRAAIVARNHVLAVEAGEGAEATLARAAGLRQWASVTHRRRGVAAIRDAADLTPAFVEAVTSAGYAGIAIAQGSAPTDASITAMIAEADKRGLFVLLREQKPERAP
jgi:DUF1009 family protein